MQIRNNELGLKESSHTRKTFDRIPSKPLKIAIVGGSNSAMRDGYIKYLQECLVRDSKRSLEFSNFAMGGVTSLFGTIQNRRYNIAKTHNVILFEYCVNDRFASVDGKYSARMAGMSLEGFIRQCKSMNPDCIIIILIFGTNLPSYYNHGCVISAIYESVARRYKIPVINVTEILLERAGIKFIKKLYREGDAAHYKRPGGTKIVAELISEQIIKHHLLRPKVREFQQHYRMYTGNLQSLQFFTKFDAYSDCNAIKKSVFKNSIFEEVIYTIRGNSSINFNFRGKLLGLMLKSDWYDGLIKITLGEKELITSSFSRFVREEEKCNLNLLSLPYYKSFNTCEFSRLSISVCQNQQTDYELDFCKAKPKVAPKDWKLSLVGIAYTGEINMLDTTELTVCEAESRKTSAVVA